MQPQQETQHTNPEHHRMRGGGGVNVGDGTSRSNVCLVKKLVHGELCRQTDRQTEGNLGNTPLLVLHAVSPPYRYTNADFGRNDSPLSTETCGGNSGHAGCLPSGRYLLLNARTHGPKLRFSLHLVEDSI